MLFFLSEIITTNLLFSSVLFAFFVRVDRNRRYIQGEIFLYSLGLGPAFTTLLLYYLFLILPRHSNLFYFSLVITVYWIIAFIYRESFSQIFGELRGTLNNSMTRMKEKRLSQKIGSIVYAIAVIIFLGYSLYLYFCHASGRPLLSYDSLGYGTIGKILFKEKSLDPIWIENFAVNGFLYKTAHAPSFSLLLVWEKIVESLFALNSDVYFKSISIYYGLLIAAVQFYWLSKANKYLALLGTAALFSGQAFFIAVADQHLDTYRMFFIIISWITLAYAIKNADLLSYILFGVFSGLGAFAHSTGMVIAALNCLILLVFMKGNLRARSLKAGTAVFFVMVLGGMHYLMDILWGRGWLLKWH